jgi:hypothetical protein
VGSTSHLHSHITTIDSCNWRVQLNLYITCILLLIGILAGTHVFNNLRDIESIWLVIKLCISRWVLIVAMQRGGKVRGGHVQLLPLDYRREGAQLAAIPREVGIELDDQLCICRGGDEFEQFLQPPTLKLLDRPLGGFKIFEVTVDVKLGLK